MANRERGSATVQIDGRTYTFRITTNAMAEAEDVLAAERSHRPDALAKFEAWLAEQKTDRPLTVVEVRRQVDKAIAATEDLSFIDFTRRLRKTKIRDIRLLIWTALLDGHPGVTMAEAGRICDVAGGPLRVMELIERVLASSQPDPADVEALGQADADPPIAAVDGVGAPPNSAPVASASRASSSGA